jgi:hypothetical protein
MMHCLGITHKPFVGICEEQEHCCISAGHLVSCSSVHHLRFPIHELEHTSAAAKCSNTPVFAAKWLALW